MTTKSGTDSMPTDDDTDDAEITPAASGMGSAFYAEARRGEALPAAVYDGCTTAAAVNARFLDTWNFAVWLYGPHTWTNPAWRGVRSMLGEEMRRAHVRANKILPVVAEQLPGGRVVKPKVERLRSTWVPPETVAGPDDTITCVGACGETKPAIKFPTVTKHGKGARVMECRACRDARMAAEREAKEK